MNPKVLTFFTALVGTLSIANGQIGSLALLGLSSGTVALTSGTLTAFLTPAGAVAVAIGIVGAGIVKKAIAANVAGLATQDFRNFGQQSAPASGYGRSSPRGRSRRANAEEAAAGLDEIDSYFYTIANIDYDDCGKRLVCEVEALPAEQRSEEEALMAGLFGEQNVIDPASPKAEYDLAAYLGSSTRSKIACARRYHKCPMDRKTIGQALEKQKAAALAAQAAQGPQN
jgi:hypothetical protein